MNIALHKNARTTPAIRAEIAASGDLSARALSQRYGVTEQTIYKWKARDSTADRSHTAHRLQTTLTPAQEAIAVELRRTLLLPLDDLLAVVREFICEDVSRSGLDRLSAPPRGGQPHRLEAGRAEGAAQGVQSLRAGLPAHGHQVLAADAR